MLTDGEAITAVIDWANAAFEDPYFDLARTMSILEIEGTALFIENKETIKNFTNGWIKGYEDVFGPIKSLSLYNAWAGLRMLRDLSGKRTKAEYERIKEWVNRWR